MSFRFIAFDTVEAAEEAFYDAMRNADLDAMMSVWADDEDIVCVHPNGPRLIGKEQVRNSWQAILDNGAVTIRAVQQHGTTGSRFALRNLIEEITVRSGRGTQIVHCVATNVFVRDIHGWRLTCHHSSPAGESPPPPSASGQVLH